MGFRRQAREVALQSLYLAESGGCSAEEALKSVRMRMQLNEQALAFAEALAYGAHAERAGLDEILRGLARNWTLERMAAVDRNLLRLGAYELLHYPDTPASVVIDEALEIAKIYSGEDSAKFLNGILDKVRSASAAAVAAAAAVKIEPAPAQIEAHSAEAAPAQGAAEAEEAKPAKKARKKAVKKAKPKADE